MWLYYYLFVYNDTMSVFPTVDSARSRRGRGGVVKRALVIRRKCARAFPGERTDLPARCGMWLWHFSPSAKDAALERETGARPQSRLVRQPLQRVSSQ